jgi:predicted permease
MFNIYKDLQYAIRTLVRNRGFAATALITLALGMGATTAMFSVVDAVLLRPLPYRDPQRLLSFFDDLSQQGYPRARVSPPEYLDFKAQKDLFRDVAAFNETAFNLSGNRSGARQLNGILTTYNLFSLLGTKPFLGRTFLPEEDRPGANHVVLLSYGFWQSEFAGNREIFGRTLRLDGEPYTVVGVMPPGFSFPDKRLTEAGADALAPIDFWAPRAFTAQELTPRGARYLLVVARLQPEVSLRRVNGELHILADQDARQYPNDMRGLSRFFAEPLQESNTDDVRSGLLLLLCAVGFVLLIACANVANLLLSRANARQREIAVRMALGAHRRRILRQLLTESALLSIAGGMLGIGLAATSFTLLKLVIPPALSVSTSLHFNLWMFAFGVLVCVLSSFLFGLAPALQISKRDLNEALREGGRGSTGSRHLLGNSFVIGEIALSLMLLVGAGLLLKSFSNLQRVNPGFQPAHVLTLDFDMAEPRYRDSNVRTRFIERVLERVRALPGVQSAGFAGGLPLTSRGWTEDVTPENSVRWRNLPANPIYRVVTPGYLEAMGIKLIRGRFFDMRDREDALPVAIINLKAAQDFWPNQDPIGKRLKLGRQDSGDPWMQVIGVTGNVKHGALTEAPRQEIYCSYLQSKSSLQWQRFLAVRTSGNPQKIVGQLRRIASDVDSDEPLNHVMLLSDIVEAETHETRMQSTLLVLFAALALIMATVGIYGVMAYLVTQRTQEIGLRMALGAHRRQIVGLVLKRGLTLTLVGTSIGVFAASMFTRFLRSLLFGVSPIDIGIMAGISTLLALTAICACLVPAHRAASVDPVEALRAE